MPMHNPYAAPRARLNDESQQQSVPIQTLRRIRNGWIAGVALAGVMTLVALGQLPARSIVQSHSWIFLHVALAYGLTIGLYYKNRSCAMLLLLYYVVTRLMIMAQTQKVGGVISTLLFLYFLSQGVLGTIEYHRIIRQRKLAENP
jgi:hypothetical protein